MTIVRQEIVNDKLIQLIGLVKGVFGEDTHKVLGDTKLRLNIKYLKTIYGYKDIEKYIEEEYDEVKMLEYMKILLDYKDYLVLNNNEKR